MNTPAKSHIETSRLLIEAAALYAVRLAQSGAEVRAAQALRFEVFNVELNEGFAESFATGHDADPFDAVCDHLIVEEGATGNVVGTYRLQTGRMAAAHRGYYTSAYSELCRKHLARPEFRTRPQPNYECPLSHLAEETPSIPKLLRAYLSVGAKICGPPALDREFKTIDFLTLLDLEAFAPAAHARFFG
jgi:putative hemolysin